MHYKYLMNLMLLLIIPGGQKIRKFFIVHKNWKNNQNEKRVIGLAFLDHGNVF